MSDQKPNYGIDAPGVMRTFAIIAFPSLLVSASTPFWPISGWIPIVVGIVLLMVGLATLFLFLVMVGYAIWGKFKQRDLMLNLINLRGDEQVLDIGTGRGLLMIGAAKRLTTGKSIGIDIWNAEDLSGNDVDNALQNAQLEGVSNKIENQKRRCPNYVLSRQLIRCTFISVLFTQYRRKNGPNCCLSADCPCAETWR